MSTRAAERARQRTGRDPLDGVVAQDFGEAKTGACAGLVLPDVLKVLAGLEADRPARWDAHFLAGPRIAADAAFARLHLKDTEAPQFDAFAALHRGPHRVEDSVDRHLGFNLGDVGNLRDLVHDVDLDHA